MAVGTTAATSIEFCPLRSFASSRLCAKFDFRLRVCFAFFAVDARSEKTAAGGSYRRLALYFAVNRVCVVGRLKTAVGRTAVGR